MATCLVSNEHTINPMVAIASDTDGPSEVPHDVAEIVIVRHGETTWNASGRIQGQLESDLNVMGWKQADAVIVVQELKERHVGSLQGLVWSEIQEKEPESYHAFFSSQYDLEIPGGGESFNQLCERSVAALEEIASRHKGERVIVVTHGGVLRAIYMSMTREPSAGKVLNASINVVHLSEKKWVFKSWSDVSHLNEVGFLQRGFNGDSFQP
ncbi:hypothetical protein HHK36_019674 [Tetracentron sinense]|uniref:Phosphoglycerate mutase n=1 Tax=Tetracentron sinense TaxID=13715 RepID=A0A834YU29_TETSI|nr:hypothetical protein HHK36_019674 [Tetracentron sinense]